MPTVATQEQPTNAASSQKKKQLKLRRIFHQNSQPQNHQDEDERAMLVAELRSMDTRIVSAEESSSRPPTSSPGGIEMSASLHEKVVWKANTMVIGPNKKSQALPPLLQPNARDSRKKERPFPVPVRRLQNKNSSIDPDGAVAARRMSFPTEVTQRQPHPQQLLPALPQPTRAPQQQQPPPQLTMIPPKADTSWIRDVRSVDESMPSACGEEVSISHTPDTVQHISPISSSVVQQQQRQQAQLLFLEKQRSLFPKSAAAAAAAPTVPAKQQQKQAESSSVGSNRTPPKERPVTIIADNVVVVDITPPFRKQQQPPSSAEVEKTPIPKQLLQPSLVASVETTPARISPPRERAADDKQLTLTPVQTNRSALEQPEGRINESNQQQQQQQCGIKRSPGKPPSAVLKAALSRPFGRESSILPNPNCWVVEVSTAEWDADQKQWKYRVQVQRRQQAEQQTVPASATAALTWRSVADFFWLEQALQQEFHGALLLPSLSLALGRTVEVASEMPVESSASLKNWLADVVNGVRGSGEWILPIVQQQQVPSGKDSIDVMKCESMESFLYLNAVGSTLGDAAAESHDSPGRRARNLEGESACNDPSSYVASFLNMALSPLELICGGPQPEMTSSKNNNNKRDYSTKSQRHKQGQRGFPKPDLPLGVMNCSSRALGTAADLEIQDSFMETASVVSGMDSAASPRGSSALAIHSELLFAEKDLALNYRATALTALEKLRALSEEEEKVGVAWKRFAVTLANLFSYEKDVENANIGDFKVKRENNPFRKVEKTAVDECLRVMARQKKDRAVPGLTALSTMLSAYVADLSSVEPSVDVYAKAIKQLSLGPRPVTESSESNNSGGITSSSISSSSSSPRPSEAKQSNSWDELKEWTMKSLTKGGLDGDSDERVRRRQVVQHEGLKNRLLTNERLLRLSLTTMFRTAPFRVSRMAWRYWNTEASQCAMLNSAAAELRSTLDMVSQSSVSKLLKRHSKDEKADCTVEMELIQRIVNLGQSKKFPSGADSATDGSISTTSINNELVEVDNDDLSLERTKALKRDKALDIARHRIGRWNAVLAMSMMEAVGVDDPNVRVEETTRDLRLVRKYAIGLRECLNRCVESVHLLQTAITGNNRAATAGKESSPPQPKQNSAANRLKRLRNDLLVEMSLLFSGTFVDDASKKIPKRSSASTAVLHRAGIDTSDPFGWIPLAMASSQRGSKSMLTRGRIGNLAVLYVNARDAQVEWLLSSLDGLLNEYYQRIEVIEGFVYMECVGIQLEKHFSAKRAKALSAFEKKTDLTAAVNLARKKRMPQLLVELEAKLQKMGPEVSHTTVKETKEAHLESKNLKMSLHELAMRRLMRARETSTERAITIMSLWAKEEEINATEELKALGEAMTALEQSVFQEDVEQIVYRKPTNENCTK